MKKLTIITMGILLGLVYFSTQAMSATIIYEASNLGGGIWERTYQLVDYVFDKDYGFTIFFDYGLYDNITAVNQGELAANGWDVLTWNPQLLTGNVKEAGGYDSLALVSNPSRSTPFIVRFNWLGGGSGTSPGQQSFETYKYTPSSTTVTPVETGKVKSKQDAMNVPIGGQPIAIFLIVCGLTALSAMRKKVLE